MWRVQRRARGWHDWSRVREGGAMYIKVEMQQGQIVWDLKATVKNLVLSLSWGATGGGG